MNKYIWTGWSGTIMVLFAVTLVILPMQACSKSDVDEESTGTVVKDGTVTLNLEKRDAAILIVDENDEITKVISVNNGQRSPVVQCQFCTPELIEKYPQVGQDCRNIWTSTLIKKIHAEYKETSQEQKKGVRFERLLSNPDALLKRMKEMTNGITPVCAATTKYKNQSGQAAFVKQTSFGSHRCAIYLKIGGTVFWEDPAGCGAWEH